MDFGRNGSRFRDQAGLSQDKLAEKADLDRTYLSGIERGVRNPSIKTVMRKLARHSELKNPQLNQRNADREFRQKFRLWESK